MSSLQLDGRLLYCGPLQLVFETENVWQFPSLCDWFSLNFLCYWKNSRSRICSIKNVTPREYEMISQSETPSLSFEVYLKLIRYFLMFWCDDGDGANAILTDAKSPYIFRRHIKMNIPDTETNWGPMSQKEGRRRVRHSHISISILGGPDVSGYDQYSLFLAHRALAYLNPLKPAN